ncbi:MAG: dihydrodipicolinate synthase family protein [Anaerolineales bacterium]
MYKGIIPALLTPFTPDQQVNPKMITKLVSYFIDQGVSGFYLCGSTGEGLLMTEEERKIVTETVVAEVNSRIPVIVHVGAPATIMAERLARHAVEVGADAIASIPPMYYLFSRLEVAAYYRRLKRAAELPLYFYNIPGLLNISLDTELAHNLYSEGVIQGMKYTHHDVLTFRGIIEACGNGLNVLSGPDEKLLNFLVMGAHGGIGTTYNCMVKVYVDIYNAWQNGDVALAQELQYLANRAISIMAQFNMIPAVKAVMQMKGLDCGDPRGPFLPLSKKEKNKLRKELDAIGFFEDGGRFAA